MIKYFSILVCLLPSIIFAQTIEDDFEGNSTITTWYGDNCAINTSFSNPYIQGVNTSNTVLKYDDNGGQYASVRFDVNTAIDLATKNTFSIKIYVPASGITGNQPNQVSLKLQDGTLTEPWTTQTEIIKPIVLDQWQEITFNFATDSYINLDSASLPPIQRTDFNRVLIQVNGEANNDYVVAYIDDINYFNTEPTQSTTPVYDNLVWSDDFDGNPTTIEAIDATKWHHQTQLPFGGSWYNGEIQHYTNRLANSYVDDGYLNIVAKSETYTNQGETKQYTSARLNSKFAFTYGKVEVKAKLPTGVGTWPAIWMLGKNINEDGAYWDNLGYDTTAWPACGEIDIMEHWGHNQNYVQSAMHTPSSHGSTVNHGGQTVSTASSDFHVYTLIWSPDAMVFSVDGIEHYTYEPEEKNSQTWPFTADQYLLLNIAIQPSITAGFSQSAMVIDYVRVYQENSLANQNFAKNIAVKMYPNPVANNLNIMLNKQIKFKTKTILMQITDVNGRLIINKTFNAVNTINQDVSSLTTGLYFVKLTINNEEQIVKKFIKK